MKQLATCLGVLVTMFWGAALSLGGCGDGGACALPPKCGEPAQSNACGCIDGQEFQLPDGFYTCKDGCLLGGGGGQGGTGGMGGSGGMAGSGGTGGSGGGSCMNVEVGQVCVRGEVQNNQEVLTAGGVVKFQVTPKGCFSSSCTVVHEASCTVMPSALGFALTGTFCLGSAGGGQGCTPDCSGGGFANCEASGVAAGMYTASVNGVMVSFEVPSSLPLGGVCAGSPF
ncbi:MAG: hypothetical protein IPM54_15515 [Polyangiaceae bacterium]|nr:hypothetical protein [Polyangiaceae bacterium]